MMAGTAYRRVIVVDRTVVESNVRVITELRGVPRLSVARNRRSNVRFLVDGGQALIELGLAIVDSDEVSASNVAVHEILGSHSGAAGAVFLESHVYGIRDVAAGEGVSYGATYVAPSPRRVALAPIGFADGLDRALSGRLRVRVDGIVVPVLGRIAMDSISLDVTDVPDVDLGSVVEVYRDAGEGGFGVTDAASALGVSPSEVICRLSERAEVTWR